MNKVISNRLLIVLIVTVASLIFVWPTFRYVAFIGSVGEDPTEEQEQRKRDLLAEGGTIRFGLDLQGGVEFLFSLDTDTMIERRVTRYADDLLSMFEFENISAAVELDEAERVIRVSGVDPADVRIAREIIEEDEAIVQWDNLDNLAGGTVTLSYRTDEFNRSIRDSVDAVRRTLQRRIDATGLTQPTIVAQPPERILVQIPGESDPERVRNTLLQTANLEFRLLHPNHDEVVRQFVAPGELNPMLRTGPVNPEFLNEEPIPGFEDETRTVVNHSAVATLLPPGYQLFLGQDSITDDDGVTTEFENLAYVLRAVPELGGDSLRRADYFFDPTEIRNNHKVIIEFDREGREIFAEVTTDNQGRRFAILLDDIVYSAPRINTPILYGSAEISGAFTQQDAYDLALVLKAGSLPAPLKIISEQSIGASLGNDSVIASRNALIIGGILLIIMMIGIYRTGGLFAVTAMLLNVLFILAILSLADATLTLSGIGGILLTMGMAVDANVLIYERLREELAAGRPIKAAINAAFSRAFSVIIDSNITTLLPAVVLLSFDIVSDSVRGFWTALAIGLVANLYTALTVTRAIVDTWVQKKKSISVGEQFAFFKNVNFDFMGYRKIGYPISGLLIGASIFYLVVHGVNPGIDFTGGVINTVEARSAEVTRPAVEATLRNAGYDDVRVVRVINSDLLQVTVPIVNNGGGDLAAVQANLAGILAESFGDGFRIVETQNIESVVGAEFRLSAFLMVLVASLVILGYIAFRFRPIFGVAAVCALLHDLLIALGIFVLLGRSLTLEIVSALLIILGYSVNDTIVVFDRIREKQGEMFGRSMREIINEAINRTLGRTVFTSGSTLIMVLSMYLFGGIGLRDFSLILLIGVAAGTYSSIFVASAVVDSYLVAKEKREGIARTQQKTVKIG